MITDFLAIQATRKRNAKTEGSKQFIIRKFLNQTALTSASDGEDGL